MIENLYDTEMYLKYKENKTNENTLNLVNYICENIGNIDLSNSNNISLCEFTTKYLFNVKIGKWNENDAKFIVHYLVKKYSKYFKLDDSVSVKFLNEEELKAKCGKDTLATCVNNSNDTFDILYSSSLISYLLSNDIDKFLRGLSIIFHELTHVMQNRIIEKEYEDYQYTKNVYIMTLETIVRKSDKQFYKTNYLNLFKENQAEKIGFKNAIEVIKKYNTRLYDMYDIEKIQEKINKYDQKLKLNYDMQIYGTTTDKVLPAMEYITTLKMPEKTKYLEMYPILKLVYNEDGTRKDVIQLYKERIRLLGKGADQTKIDTLYECIINDKLFVKDSCKIEANQLVDYVRENGCRDKFLSDLLLYRLKKGKLTQEKIDKIFELLGINIEQEQETINKIY